MLGEKCRRIFALWSCARGDRAFSEPVLQQNQIALQLGHTWTVHAHLSLGT